VPLSEHEQRVLAEIERHLHESDPKFAATVSAPKLAATNRRRLVWSAIGLVAGLICMLSLTFSLVLGIVGFALMLVSLVAGAVAVRNLNSDRMRHGRLDLRGAHRRRDTD